MADNFNGRPQLSSEEREIIEALRTAGDHLDNDPRLRAIIQDIATGARASLSYNVFIQSIRQFVALATSTTRISAKMVEKVVRIFILMWRGPELSDKVLHELYPGTSVDSEENDTVDGLIDDPNYIPQEVALMDDEFIERYKNVLKTGKQTVRSIRLMIVGMFGVGKTSLVENLIEREENSQRKQVESTVGIDVTHCNITDGKWIENIFDNNVSDKFREVMHCPNPSDVPYDDVDAGNDELTIIEDRKLADRNEDENYEVLYERSPRVDIVEEESKAIKSASKKESDKDAEELKKKLIQAKDDNPELHAFVKDILESAEKPQNSLDSTISIWDFAGQYIYYSTHHFFLNSRSIYLLMMDISIPLNNVVEEKSGFPLSGFIPKDFTCLEAFKFWLNSIHMYSTQVETDVQPSVILVGTRKDKLNGTDLDKEKQKDEYFDEALQSLKGSPALKYVHRKKFLINNLDKHEDFCKIREEVVKLAKRQRYWGEARPAKWISLERTFLGLKSEGKEIITFDEVKKVDRERSEIPIHDEGELRFFLKFQHSLGNILYYETAMLKNYIILSPQWIIDAFRCFITHVEDKDPQQLKDWDTFKEKAILTQGLIDEIIDHTEENKCFRDYKQQVIEYMEHLDMIAKPIDSAIYGDMEVKADLMEEEQKTKTNTPGDHKANAFQYQTGCHSNESFFAGQRQGIETSGMEHDGTTDTNSASPVHFYIVPSLLKLRPEHQEIDQLTNLTNCKQKTPILCFKFMNKFMPPSVFHRLLAVCIKKWTISTKEKRSLLFNGFAVFVIKHTTVLSLWFQDNIIYARVSFLSKVDFLIAQKVRKFLFGHLTEILRILPKESRISELMPFEQYIQCSLCFKNFKADAGLIRIEDLFTNNEVMCDNDLHAVSKDECVGLWCYNSIQKQKTIAIPDAVLQRQPTAKEMARVAGIIGNEYPRLRKELGLESAVVHQIEDHDKFHLPTRIYHMLCKWNKRRCSVKQLRNALIAVEVDIDNFDDIFMKKSIKTVEELEGIDFNRKPSEEELASVASRIGHEYWLLGVELGLSEIRLENLTEENRNLAKRVYYMLLEWNNGDSSIGCLGNAMCLVGSNMEGFYKVFSQSYSC